MKLVIAEKPSVAQSIAKVIGATGRKDGYIEGNGYLVSWCFGHLVELAQPQEYDPKYEKWKKDDLPIFPSPFKYDVTDSTKKQFKILKNLMNRDDVTSLVEATDAGREGELIFRLVYHQAKCKKPFERLWISSMEDVAIQEGFEHLKPSREYDALYEAALCRERADWIVGINATRLFSTLYGQTLNVGRVMTPTLGMIVGREAEIEGFRPEPFYSVQIYVAGIPMSGERIKDKADAEQLLSQVQEDGKVTIQSMKSTEKTEKAPLLYDLTSLQRDANKYYGFTAQQTLDYTQSLYEKKLVTYPRTDSRYLTDEMGDSTRNLADKMKEKFGFMKALPMHEDKLLNSKKVSDHHAIIPTVNVSDSDFSEIPNGEQKILSLITARLLAALGAPAEITEYDLSVTCGGQIFTAKSKVMTKAGWKEIQDWILGSKTCEADDEDTEIEFSEKNSLKDVLAADPNLLSEGRTIPACDPQIKEGKTTPKKRFTESSLLSAMERAGADEIPDDAERKGLGTPATRAGIIEKLVRIGFLERKGDKKTSHLIEDVHSYIISQSLELFLDELTDSTYQKKDKSNIETVNPTGCNSYMTYSYYLLLDKDAFVKELNYVTEKNNCAMKLVTRGNPPTRSLTIYPKSLAVTSADFIEQLTNFIVSKDPKYQEEKSKLIKRIDKLDRKLIKNAKNPTGFWETVVGAFVDLFS